MSFFTFKISVFRSTVLLLLLAGCGQPAQNQADKVFRHTVNRLAQHDIIQMQTESESGPRLFDSSNGHAFSRVFGSTKSKDVYEYFRARVSHILSQDDEIQISVTPHDFYYKNWLAAAIQPE